MGGNGGAWRWLSRAVCGATLSRHAVGELVRQRCCHDVENPVVWKLLEKRCVGVQAVERMLGPFLADRPRPCSKLNKRRQTLNRINTGSLCYLRMSFKLNGKLRGASEGVLATFDDIQLGPLNI